MTTLLSQKPSIYYVATGCLHPEENYNQHIHMIGSIEVRNKNHYSKEEISSYIAKDIAWRISLNAGERHLPSLKYVKTGELHEDEPFDPNIHKQNRNIRSFHFGKQNYFYDPEVVFA